MPIKRLNLLLRLLIPLATLPAAAAENLYGSVGLITGDGWSISGLEVTLDLTGDALRGEIRIDELDLDAAGRSFSDTVIDCGRIALTARAFACRDAAFSVDLPGAGRRRFPGSLVYERRSATVRFELRQAPVAGGLLAASGTASETAIGIDFTGDGLQFADLAALAGEFASIPDGFAASGGVDLTGSLRTGDGALSHMEIKAELSAASLANEAGTFVTAAVDGVVDIAASRAANGWPFTVDVAANAGEIYVEPVYANFAEDAVTIQIEGIASGDFDEFDLASLSLEQGSLLDVSGTLEVRLPEADGGDAQVSGTIRFDETSVEAVYSGFLQVFAAGTLFGDLDTAGTVSGTVAVDDNAPVSADLVFDGLTVDDRQGRFAIYEIDGALRWPGPGGKPSDAAPSSLRWRGASAYSIPFGGGSIEARLGGNDFLLLEPLRMPTMGGALLINRLSVSNLGEADASGLLDAELEPIQLGSLTAAFGWPAFSGSLSGKLPLLQYDGGVMTLGGTLGAQAFDGDIEFANLKLEQPFGLVPRLSGDLRLRQLDLELLTNTFSFGLIQGRLSGDVSGLEMVAWRPVAMDLHLYTPPGDESRRRISQRAVENLASVGGGGAAAALSSGFMKFFDVFAYADIGIRCVLRDGACAMSGAGPAGRDQPGGGYFIVKGSGLPRIDVVGYRSQVSWPRLVRQLEQIMESGAPVVE
jgi:hypothetical protein